MSRRERLSLGQRIALFGINSMSRLTVGWTAPFLEELVKTYGLRDTFKKGATVQGVMDMTEEQLGERDSHILIGYASLWNGCQYCALGHIYAGNLAHFRDTGELFPLDEAELKRHMEELDDEAILAYTRERLADEKHARLRGLLERQFRLKRGEELERGADDDLLEATIAAYDFINHCSIYGEGDAPYVALSPIHRKRKLRRRYHEQRANGAA